MPGMLPPTISTTPNSPMVWAKLRATPVTTPETDKGKTTRKKVRSREAPNVCEAATNRESTAANEAAKGCTANGKLYRIDPINRPSKVNARVLPVIAYQPRPNGLCAPSATSTEKPSTV